MLVPVPLGGTADGYLVGDTVIFSGFPIDGGKIQRWAAWVNTVGTVTGINPGKNKIAVTYTSDSCNAVGRVSEKTMTKKRLPFEIAPEDNPGQGGTEKFCIRGQDLNP